MGQTAWIYILGHDKLPPVHPVDLDTTQAANPLAGNPTLQVPPALQ